MKISVLTAIVATAAMTTSCGMAGVEMTGARSGGHAAGTGRSSMHHVKGMAGDPGRAGMEGMERMEMAGMHMRTRGPMPGPSRPSAAAAMICAGETGRAIQRTFSLHAVPSRQQMWMPPVYGCVWRLPAGVLEMAVDDAKNAGEGRRRFAALRARTSRPHRIAGVASFGLPAFESSAGTVVFLKDGKVLSVDARRVAQRNLPKGFSREAVAYAVASAVIGCWSE